MVTRGERGDAGADCPQHHPGQVPLVEKIGAESTQIRDGHSCVPVSGGLELLQLLIAPENLASQAQKVAFTQRRQFKAAQHPAEASDGDLAGLEVQVRSFVFDQQAEEVGEAWRPRRHRRRERVRFHNRCR
jgi:hypothetical protein